MSGKEKGWLMHKKDSFRPKASSFEGPRGIESLQEQRAGESRLRCDWHMRTGGAQARGPVPSSNALREEGAWQEAGAAKAEGGVLRGPWAGDANRQLGEFGLHAGGRTGSLRSWSLEQGWAGGEGRPVLLTEGRAGSQC